jgi:hypothetical protein
MNQSLRCFDDSLIKKQGRTYSTDRSSLARYGDISFFKVQRRYSHRKSCYLSLKSCTLFLTALTSMGTHFLYATVFVRLTTHSSQRCGCDE